MGFRSPWGREVGTCRCAGSPNIWFLGAHSLWAEGVPVALPEAGVGMGGSILCSYHPHYPHGSHSESGQGKPTSRFVRHTPAACSRPEPSLSRTELGCEKSQGADQGYLRSFPQILPRKQCSRPFSSLLLANTTSDIESALRQIGVQGWRWVFQAAPTAEEALGMGSCGCRWWQWAFHRRIRLSSSRF